MQPEVVGSLSTASVSVNFSSGSIQTQLAGSFPDGRGSAETGNFNLTGSVSAGAFQNNSDGGLVSHSLFGTVTSPNISSAGGNSCSNGCSINGRTDQIFVGPFASAIGGAFNADNNSAAGSNSFIVSGTYLLEQNINLPPSPVSNQQTTAP